MTPKPTHEGKAVKEPDGYVLIKISANSPSGFWYVGAYSTKDAANKDRKHNPGSRVLGFRLRNKS